MSDQNNQAAPQNTSQGATEQKPAGQEAPKADAQAPINSAPTQSTEAPKADKPVDIVYELKKADGTAIDAAQADKIVSFAKEHGLSNAQAQAIYNRENEVKASLQSEQEKQFNERKTQWVDTLKADKEFGGQYFDANSQLAMNAFKKFADSEFAQTVEESGFGNHPGFVKLFFKLGKAMESKDFVHAQNGAPDNRPHTKSVLYDKK